MEMYDGAIREIFAAINKLMNRPTSREARLDSRYRRHGRAS